MTALDPQIFKANDIRGTYPDELDERFAYLLGRAAAEQLGARRVAVGRDCRLSSPALYAAFACGIRDAGGTVGAVGLCPIELLYYLMGTRDEFDLAAMVTASHNPPQYNGFKLVARGMKPVDERAGLRELSAWVSASDAQAPAKCDAPPQDVFAEDEYVRFALATAGAPDVSGLKVVVDPGNGTGGILWRVLSDALGVAPVRMNFEPDGRFPSHHPNPAKLENLEPLRARVLAEKADVGFAYDGDADRAVVVLGDGHVMDGSEMIVALVEHLLAGGASARCAVSMVASRKALDYVRARGEEPLIVPVGHAKVKRIMQAEPLLAFAGEQSGHYFYREFFCCESSLLTGLHVLHLAASGRLASLVAQMPGPWMTPAREPEFRFTRRDDALATCRAAARAALKEFPGCAEIMCEGTGEVRRQCAPGDLAGAEGVRVDYEDWWFAMRPSGTEPLARLSVEARTEQDLQAKLNALCKLFEAHRRS